MASDILASLKPRSVEDIDIAGRTFTIPAMPARAWLDILLEDAWRLSDIIPGELAEDGATDHVMAAMMQPGFDMAAYEETVYDVIGAAAGRPWWAALRLLAHATSVQLADWTRAQLVLHHVDAEKLSLAAWLDALYGIFTQHMDSNRVARFDSQLNLPPRSGPAAKIDRRRQRANFEAVMAN